VREIHFAIYSEDLVQYIEMPFASYGRAMRAARCLCGSWASCCIVAAVVVSVYQVLVGSFMISRFLIDSVWFYWSAVFWSFAWCHGTCTANGLDETPANRMDTSRHLSDVYINENLKKNFRWNF